MPQQTKAPEPVQDYSFLDYVDRFNKPKMEFYREVYKDSPRWQGHESLYNKTVVVYFEQGLGDAIHFVRYIPELLNRGCRLIFHVDQSLFKLFEQFNPIAQVDRYETNLPEHDYHVTSMSLPFLLSKFKVDVPYLNVTEKADLGFPEFIKIGIAWEGNPEHSNNDDRCCHLSYFKQLCHDKIKFFMIQKEIHRIELIAGAEDFEMYGCEVDDMYDTAKVINSLDYIISVDTSVMHLAGAMGKNVYCLLSHKHDSRWGVADWYPTISFIDQEYPDNWDWVFYDLACEMSEVLGIPELKPAKPPVDPPIYVKIEMPD